MFLHPVLTLYRPTSAMVRLFAGALVILVQKLVKRTVFVKTNAQAICEEFSDKIIFSSSVVNSKPHFELKCEVEYKYFRELKKRMYRCGYVITQAQRDIVAQKVFVWFEPIIV